MELDFNNFRFPTALSVTEINAFIKDLLDETPPLRDLYIKGEISNFKPHSSGHMYFSLKDSESNIKCVMFKFDAMKIGFVPENGMTVIAHGRISSFVRDGAYQLYVNDMQPDGIGAMYIALEQLKKKLESMGLTSDDRKKAIPKIPRKVGVVTSPTGAAVRDIINVTGRRFPFSEIIVYPSLVQGDGAIDSIVAGIEYFNTNSSVDVLIVGRGGGSIEDLWAFNSEKVALAVANSNIPVISAVGHETDFTICDMVSDVRAPTPSAAAEICVPDTEELKHKFNNIVSKLQNVLESKLDNYKTILEVISSSRVLQSPKNSIDDRRMTLISISDDLEKVIKNKLELKKKELQVISAELNALSPLNVLSRGYSAVFSEEKIINSVDNISIDENLTIKVSDGNIKAKVYEINKEK